MRVAYELPELDCPFEQIWARPCDSERTPCGSIPRLMYGMKCPGMSSRIETFAGRILRSTSLSGGWPPLIKCEPLRLRHSSHVTKCNARKDQSVTSWVSSVGTLAGWCRHALYLLWEDMQTGTGRILIETFQLKCLANKGAPGRISEYRIV